MFFKSLLIRGIPVFLFSLSLYLGFARLAGEEGMRQSLASCGEGQAFRGSSLGLGNDLIQQSIVGQQRGQALRPRRFREAAGGFLAESELFDGAVAAQADGAAEEGVAGHLSGHGGAVQLENDPVPGDGPQVSIVWHAAFEHPEAVAGQACGHGLEQAQPLALVWVHHGDMGAGGPGHLKREGERRKVIAGRLKELARAQEDARPFGDGDGEVPFGQVHGVGGRNEVDGRRFESGRQGDSGAGRRDDAGRQGEQLFVRSPKLWMSQLFADLGKAALLPTEQHAHTGTVQLGGGLETGADAASQQEEAGGETARRSLVEDVADGLAERSAGAGGEGVEVDGRMDSWVEWACTTGIIHHGIPSAGVEDGEGWANE